jgi:hypothetical protein
MRVNHPTHLLFLEPTNAPSIEAIEDELTKKVDYIFSTLIPTSAYRGSHRTPFGEQSDNRDYEHPVFPIISNSLATYYVRHHRQDITEDEVKWVEKIYDILNDESHSYCDLPFDDKITVMIYDYKRWDYGKTIDQTITLDAGTDKSSFLKNKLFKVFK